MSFLLTFDDPIQPYQEAKMTLDKQHICLHFVIFFLLLTGMNLHFLQPEAY